MVSAIFEPMSNEKPVRITVGDVKEVVEATTIQADTVISKPVSSISYTASVPDTSGFGMVYLGGIVGFVLLLVAGYFGVMKAPAASSALNVPAVSVPSTPSSNIAPVSSTNTEAPVNAGDSTKNAPADTNMASNNAPAK